MVAVVAMTSQALAGSKANSAIPGLDPLGATMLVSPALPAPPVVPRPS
jgi:hypothetical protein